MCLLPQGSSLHPRLEGAKGTRLRRMDPLLEDVGFAQTFTDVEVELEPGEGLGPVGVPVYDRVPLNHPLSEYGF